MPGPWDKYAQQAPEADGPWSKYGAKDDSFDPAAAIQGAGQFASANYLPEITGAVGKLIPDPNAMVDAQLKGQGFNINQPEFKGATADDSRALQKKYAADSPYSYYGGGVAGAVLSAPAYGAALKGLGIAKDVPKLAQFAEGTPALTKAAAYGKNLGARMLQAGKEGAALGLASNPNNDQGDEGFNFGGRIKNAAIGGAGSALVPAAVDAVKGAANASGAMAKWAGTKALSNVGGVKPDVINEYAKFSDRINAAPSVDALKEVSDNFVGKLHSDVEAKSLSQAEAQQAYKAFESDLKDAYKTAGYDARDAVTSAQQTLKDAHNARLQQLSGDVYDTVNKLKGDVQAGSGKALDVLDKSGAKVDLAPVTAHIDETVAKLEKAGTDEALSVADKLKAYKERLLTNQETSQVGFQPSGKLEQVAPAKFENTPDSLRAQGKLLPARYINGSSEDQWLKNGILGKQVAPAVEMQPIGPKFGTANKLQAEEVKPLIQGIDRTTTYSPFAGTFDKEKNAAFKGVRAKLDEQLKNAVPEYRQMMEPVAKDASLLERVSDFGDKQSSASLLGRLDSPSQMERKAALQELGKKYGVDFLAGAKAENLPEYQLLQKAKAAQDALRPDRVAEKLDQTLATSRQKSAFDAAKSDFEQAKAKLAPFKSLAPNGAGQTQAQQKLMQLAKGKNIELEGMFHELGKLSGTDFVQAMKDNAIQEAFKKGATNGSRNTLMGAVAGWVIGGPMGAGYGAAAGRAVDQWGPAMTKRILDGAIKVSRSPSVATIRALNIPEAAKRNMIIGLENYMSKESGSAMRPQMVAQNDADREPAVIKGGKDPQIQSYAKTHKLTYDMADAILRKRGYGR